MKITVRARITHNRFPELIAKLPGAASAIVAKTAHNIQIDAKLNLIDKRAVDTGTLLNSIQADIKEFYAEVGPATDYAYFVEFGTRKMPARPYMIPAADKNEPLFIEAMERMLRSLA